MLMVLFLCWVSFADRVTRSAIRGDISQSDCVVPLLIEGKLLGWFGLLGASCWRCNEITVKARRRCIAWTTVESCKFHITLAPLCTCSLTFTELILKCF